MRMSDKFCTARLVESASNAARNYMASFTQIMLSRLFWVVQPMLLTGKFFVRSAT